MSNKIIKILKAIFTLGYSLYKEWKQNKNQIDALLVSGSKLRDEFQSIRDYIKSDNPKNFKDIYRAVNPDRIKNILKATQEGYGVAHEIGGRLKELYNDNKHAIEEFKGE